MAAAHVSQILTAAELSTQENMEKRHSAAGVGFTLVHNNRDHSKQTAETDLFPPRGREGEVGDELGDCVSNACSGGGAENSNRQTYKDDKVLELLKEMRE